MQKSSDRSQHRLLDTSVEGASLAVRQTALFFQTSSEELQTVRQQYGAVTGL